MSTANQTSHNLLEVSFACSSDELREICLHAYSNDPNMTLSLHIEKGWRPNNNQPAQLLVTADECDCEVIPLGAFPLDGSGHHFMVYADVYKATDLKHCPLIVNPTTGKYLEGPSITRGCRIVIIMDTGCGLGYIDNYSPADHSYTIQLAPSDRIAFSTGIMKPRLCFDKIDEQAFLATGDPSADDDGSDDEDA